MARAEIERNTYEEDPDECKELLEKNENHTGERIRTRLARSDLLREHERNLKLLTSGAVGQRNFILPLPYPPAKIPLSSTQHTYIKDVKISSHDPNCVVVVRAITDPYVYSASITVVEDENGDVARLTVCNLEDSFFDPVLARESIMVVRQPCWTITPDGSYHIRVDHPSDLLLLDSSNKIVPSTWRCKEEYSVKKTSVGWKEEGDTNFLNKKFREALACYNQSLSERFDVPANIVERVNLHRKQCGVNMVLLRFDDAAKALAQAITTHAQSDASLQQSGLIDTAMILDWLHDHCNDDRNGICSALPQPLKDLAMRIKFDLGIYQNNGDYKLTTLSSFVGQLSLHVDAANYIIDTEIRQTQQHGRGLYAKHDFKAGDLVMAEKAFALPGYIENDRGNDCSLYSLGDGTATDRAGALLYKELVQKLVANPSQRKAFFEMDDGGYCFESGWDVAEDTDVPVDVFRIEHIRRRNCFAAPIRSLDALRNPGIPVRNGFWIHTSYINHSCLPNSVRTFLGDLMLLRATRDISAGEEITAQYVTPELTTEDRQQKYKGTWGFECDCRLCEVERNVGSDVERQRMIIFEELKVKAQKLGHSPFTVTALKKFAKRLRELEALYGEDEYARLPRLCLVHPTLFLTEAWRSLKNNEKMMDSAHKLLRNFGIETKVEGAEFMVISNCGLVNVECVRALKYLAEGHISMGRAELASSIMATAKVWFRTITGADVGSEEFLQK
ncbi:hypothetical protein DE146DRAFT_735078 [Phaeosphaeria sp. MPI-PUGE-AT-0046c]|nr:hypothetical protein DE146DRAFT_735078 [Phaeosphaeria sp. MPI-PUGE-AT-0046c]